MDPLAVCMETYTVWILPESTNSSIGNLCSASATARELAYHFWMKYANENSAVVLQQVEFGSKNF